MITQENKDILNQYAKVKADMKLLETMAEELNPQVLAIMNDNEVEEIEVGELGKLCIGSRRKWSYTPETMTLEKELKSSQKEEQQTGAADYTENRYVIFKTNEN